MTGLGDDHRFSYLLKRAFALAATTGSGIDESQIVWDTAALEALARDLASGLRATSPPHQLCTRVLTQISRSSIATFPGRPEISRALAVQAGLILVDTLLRPLDQRLSPDVTPDLRRVLAQPRVRRDQLRRIAQKAIISRTTRPVLLILTPLSQINDEAQARLLAVADLVEASPAARAYRLVVPGRSLHPGDEIRGSRRQRAAAERRLVLSASRIFVVVAEHDSWGAAKCVSIAESVGIPVTVYTTRPDQLSRVLSEDVPGTTYLPFDGVKGVARDIIKHLENEPTPAAAWEKRTRLHERLHDPKQHLAAAMDQISERLSPRVRARLEASAQSSSEILSLTLAELYELQEHAPDFTADVVHSVFGASSLREREHNDVDPLDAQLNPDLLRFFCAENDVTTNELIEMLRAAADRPRLVAGRLRANQNLRYLKSLLDHVRSR